MAEQEPNLEDIKEALVSSGILKSANLSEAERANIQKALAAKGGKVDLAIICSRNHYCIVHPK